MSGAILKPARIGSLLFLILFAAVGCTVGWAHFSHSYEVTDAFENGQLLKDHQYYYFGHPYSPDALVAVKQGYVLSSPKWQPIKWDERQLKERVERMSSQPGAEYGIFSNGARIFNEHSELVGAWYSVWQLPYLTFIDNTTFAISDPINEFPHGGGDSDFERGGTHIP